MVLLVFSSSSHNLLFTQGSSIALSNSFPTEGTTYALVDHFILQTTDINTNTTVSVSIDGGPLIPMKYQGIKNELATDDTIRREWYTWTINVSPITESGIHTFKFHSNYYVWQQTDQYWAEFNSYTNDQSFIIQNPMTSPSSQPTKTNIEFPTTILGLIIAAIALFVLFIRWRPRQK